MQTVQSVQNGDMESSIFPDVKQTQLLSTKLSLDRRDPPDKSVGGAKNVYYKSSLAPPSAGVA